MKARTVSALLLAGLCVLALPGCGITAPRGSEGYADLDSLGYADTDRVLSLSIGPALLKLAASHVDDDTQTRELLRDLDGVRVQLYEIDGDAARVSARIVRMSRKLQADGWQRVMLVRSHHEEAHMLIRLNGDRVCGLTVLVSDGQSEAIVVNLMGKLQPEQFGRAMLALDIDAAGVAGLQPGGDQDS